MTVIRQICKDMAEIFSVIGELPDEFEPQDAMDNIILSNIHRDMNTVKDEIKGLAERCRE